ncbi:MAG: DUF3109 family protein [Bacteroidales bacterium]
MLIIKNTLVSDDLYRIRFACRLKKCLGACCIEGDAGASLEEEEIATLEDDIENIKPYMTGKGRAVVGERGVFDYDSEGHYVTPLVRDRECAYAIFDKGIAMCAIEKAFEEGGTDLQKPVSCHLYPIRISVLSDGRSAVNYHAWDICSKALITGKRKDIPIYRFCRDALVRKFGKDWYRELDEKASEMIHARKGKNPG